MKVENRNYCCIIAVISKETENRSLLFENCVQLHDSQPVYINEMYGTRNSPDVSVIYSKVKFCEKCMKFKMQSNEKKCMTLHVKHGS